MPIALQDIKKTYSLKNAQSVQALCGVSYTFPQSGMVFIVGKSGSGKSTLLNILGLLDTYDGGDMSIFGRSCSEFSEKERDQFRAEYIGFVFQEFHIIEKYTIGQNISLPLEIKQEHDQHKVEEVLQRVGLEGFAHRNPAQISGGQRQRVAIARAIIKDPKIILADEPTGSLDSVNGSEIFNLLQELSKTRLVIVVSHDLESAHKYADQIIELKDGQIDSIYEGDGGAEAVRFVKESIEPQDLQEYNSLLEQGKKVTISRPKPKKQLEEAQPLNMQSSGNVRLPFKGAMKLSFYSMKSKWVRTLITIFISMFAVAFFGFADLVATFDSNELLVQELDSKNASFVNVGLERVEDLGIYSEYHSASIYEEQASRFEALGIENYRVRQMPMYLFATNSFQSIFPGRSGNYYGDSIWSFIECDDVGRLGYTIIEGRAPQNFNEMLITTYHMQVFEVFGFKNQDVNIPSVKSFSEIQDLAFVYGTWVGRSHELRIVGLIEVDTSYYEPLWQVKEPVNTITDHQKQLLKEFEYDFVDLGSVYVLQGFYQVFMQTASMFTFKDVQLGIEDDFTDAGYVYTFDKKMADNQNVVLKQGMDFDNIGTKKAIVSVSSLRRIVPGASRFRDTAEEFCEQFDVLGKQITLNAEIHSPQDVLGEISVTCEIVGVYAGSNEVYVSEDFCDLVDFDHTLAFKLPASTHQQRQEVVRAVNNAPRFVIEEDSFQFFCGTYNYSQIRQINTYFVLFINVFSIAALVLCIFAMLLTYTFISQSINLRKKDIGIIRSLGARKQDIALIFVIEGVFIALLEILLGAITAYVGFVFLDKYFITQLGTIAEMYSIVSFSLRQVLLMTLATIIAVAISLFIPIWRISHKQPVDAIRS